MGRERVPLSGKVDLKRILCEGVTSPFVPFPGSGLSLHRPGVEEVGLGEDPRPTSPTKTSQLENEGEPRSNWVILKVGRENSLQMIHFLGQACARRCTFVKPRPQAWCHQQDHDDGIQ